jgi:predicted enzyme related to lactoylglutathione lyase
MSERDTYPAGVPCWVETLQREPRAAQDFYASLFGWELAGSEAYSVARVRGLDVAGIGALPDAAADLPASWITHVRVESADDAAREVEAAGGTILLDAFDAEPAGRLAVVADPTGATFCVWEAGIRDGAQLVNEPGAWAMSALQTTDPQAALEFYGAVFGWEPEPFGPITLLRLPGYVGGTEQQPVPRDVVAVLMPGDAAQWGVDFWVADADATAARAAELGGTTVVPPHDEPGFRNAVLADPAGATFSVSQLVAAAA